MFTTESLAARSTVRRRALASTNWYIFIALVIRPTVSVASTNAPNPSLSNLVHAGSKPP